MPSLFTCKQEQTCACVDQARALVTAAVRFIQDVSVEGDAAEGDVPEAAEQQRQLQEVEALRREAEELAANSGLRALKRVLAAVELLLFYAVKTEVAAKCAAVMYLTSRRQQVVLARIGEVLWLAKDAVDLARDVQECVDSSHIPQRSLGAAPPGSLDGGCSAKGQRTHQCVPHFKAELVASSSSTREG